MMTANFGGTWPLWLRVAKTNPRRYRLPHFLFWILSTLNETAWGGS